MHFASIDSATRQTYSVWEKAVSTTAQADPFCCTPVWQFSFHDAFSPQRRLLIEESSNSVIAFAEKVFSPDKVYLTPIEPHWFFGCPLLGKQSSDMLFEAIPFFAETYAPFFPKILISGIRPKRTLARRLLKLFRSSFNVYLYATGLQCAASLAGGVDGYVSRRTANHRSKLKKSARRASEAGVSFERVIPASAKEAEAVYSRMLSVERASWKGIGQCGMAEPPARQFYDIMLQRLAVSRAARVIFARYEGKDIGFIFGGITGRTYRGQQFSYDDEWKRFSLGSLMQMEQITWLCEEGATRYDMGPLAGPRMEYKAHWTEKEIAMETWMFEKK